jgi:cyclic beta-1,2-glucan synthetase
MQRYRVEPYAVAADVYAHPLQAGRGGWTWYTGSAAWLYRFGLESILGMTRRGTVLSLDPCIPTSWPGFATTLRLGGSRYEITVTNPDRLSRGIMRATLDGKTVDPSAIPFVDDGAIHQIHALMGQAAGGDSRKKPPPA